MSSTPLGTRLLKVKLGTTEQTAAVTHVDWSVADADNSTVTFADAASGGSKQHTLNFTATQDPGDTTSIWSQIYNSPGATLAVSISPYGATTATATNPIITGNVIVSWPSGVFLGGDADTSTSAQFTMDLAWDFTAKPTLVTTGSF